MIQNIDQYRLPPHSLEAEEALISSCLNGYSPDEIFDVLCPDDFYRTANGCIFEQIKRLKNAKQPIDYVTVSDALRGAGKLEVAGGVSSIVQMTETPIAVNPGHYANVIKSASTARKMLEASFKTIEDVYGATNDNLVEVIDSAQCRMLSIEAPGQKCEATHIRDIIADAIDRCERATTQNGVTGITTGLKDVDYLLGGLQQSDLIILAARPGMGKTALCMNIVERCGVPALVFSLEMDKEKLSFRMLAGKSNINLTRLTTGRLIQEDWEGLANAAEKLSDLPIYVDDSPSLHYSEIRRRSRLMSKKFGIKLIVIDYLQLMRGDNSGRGNREVEVSSISRSLKSIAKELNIPVVALAQLNRELEKRSNKRPELSDLRESGCLHGNTLVLNRNHKQLQKIKELDTVRNIDIMSLNKNKGDIVMMKKGFKSGTKQLYEIELITGHKILATGNHKFLEFENTWTRLDSLSSESLIAIPLSFDLRWPGQSERDLCEARFIAMMLGNGCSRDRRSTQYTSNILDSDLCDTIIKDADAITNGALRSFKKDTICESRNTKWTNVFFPSLITPSKKYHNPINEYLKQIGLFGKSAKEKEIPGFVFFEHEPFRVEFIKHLFATDGTIHITDKPKRNVIISYSSTSYQLISGLQLLLQSVGILSTIQNIKQGKYSWFTLSIFSLYFQKKYLNEIGFAGERKSIINRRAIDFLEDINPGWTQYILNNQKTLAYVKIKNINVKEIDDVYDIEVPKTHNFIANGIVVHNSIEQDADVVMFIYRDEVYNRDEHNPKKGQAEIIISKHRNGPTGTAVVQFIPSTTTFKNLFTEKPFAKNRGEK